jgi:hypothetical protein
MSAPSATGGSEPGPLIPLAEAVEGITDLGLWLAGQLGGHARTVAERIGGGTYTPDLAAADAARSVALAAAAWLRILNEVVDAAVIVARPPKPNTPAVEVRLPAPFEVPCTLRLEGSLKSRFDPPDVIPRTRVTIDPPRLRAKQVEFTVTVDATRRPGVSYFGRVIATPDDPDVGSQSVDFRVGVR